MRELARLEQAYLSQTEPERQSGFLGGNERWRIERELILDAVDAGGDFLDIGCANGYLLECLVQWAREKSISITPYGIDVGSGLIRLAKERLPEHADHLWVANAWDWQPPRRFRYVYTLTDYVPDDRLAEYLNKLLDRYVEPGGLLIVGAYGSYSRNEPAIDLRNVLGELGFEIAGSSERGKLPISRIVWLRRD